MKTTPFLLAVLILSAAACAVDVNEGTGEGDDGPAAAECPPNELATVRFMHAAGGTPVTRPDFGPATTRNLNVVRPDFNDPATNQPKLIVSLAAGRAGIAQVCGNKPMMFGARLAGAKADRMPPLQIMFTPDPDPKLLAARTTIVLAGIADSLTPEGAPENPASAANPLRFIVVDDMFSSGPETQIQVVEASRVMPATVDVDVNPDVAGAELTGDKALDRYEVSVVETTKGTVDAMPVAVPVRFLVASTVMQTFTIAPRVPAGAKVLAIHFDTEIYDPKAPTPPPAPVARLFLTGNDPLLGLAPGGGITF
jgi:hypothetical protein